MSMSVCSTPPVRDRSFPLVPLKEPPGAVSHYCVELLRSSHGPFNPLRSLGRLVSDTPAGMQLGLGVVPSYLNHSVHHSSVLQERLYTLSHLGRLQLTPGRTPSHFSSPSSDRSSVTSSSPARDAVILGHGTCHTLESTLTYRFSAEELQAVLYGYCPNQDQDQEPKHAISGLNTVCDSVLHPLDTEAQDLPEGLTVLQTTYGGVSHCGVFVGHKSIPKGSRFGPFQGRMVNTSEIKTHDDNTLMWEIFENGRLSHFVDGRGSSGNWMSLVKCARFPEEQNLLAVQSQGRIYYEACKEIRAKQELLVWYGDSYLQFLGIPLTLKDMSEEGNTEIPAEDSGEGFKCDRCGKVFAYKYYRDKHLKYTRCVDQGDRKFPCHLCNRSFEKRDRLRIHILHVHEKHRPHKCSVCGKSFSQSSSLNKHMRVHSGERPYKCVYCNKAFTASSILRTHIRQHSGEKPFKCKHCGKAFASHAAHDSHVRRSHAKERLQQCNICGSAFQEAQQLKQHMKSHKEIPPVLSVDNHNILCRSEEVCRTQRRQMDICPYTTQTNAEYRPWN